MRKTTILLAAQLLLATQEAPAARLSLTSTNDYRYIKFPTNGVVDIRGLGTGSEGLYRMPRREDMAFLTESLLERMDVSEALLHDAHEVIAPDYVANPASYKRHYAALPNYWQNPILSQEVFLDSGIFGTNACRMVVPTNLKRSTWTLYDRPSDYTDYSNTTNLFVDGRYTVSRRLFDQFNRSHWTSSTLLGTSALAFGYVTNAYHDICANTATTFCQTARTSCGGSVTIKDIRYNPHEMHGLYDFKTGRWIVNFDYDDITTVSTNLNPYVKYGPSYVDCLKRRSLYKYSRAAFSNSIEFVSRSQERLSTNDERTRSHIPNVTMPKFSNGSTLTNIIAASAVIWYQHVVREGTNYHHNVSKILVMPTTLTRSGETSEGYPAFSDNATTDDYIELCERRDVIPDTDFTDEQLYSMFDYPDYPTVTRPSTTYKSNQSLLTEEIRTSVICYVGLADVTFNAMVLNND